MGDLQLTSLEQQLKDKLQEVSDIQDAIEALKVWPREGADCYKINAEGEIEAGTYLKSDFEGKPLLLAFETLEEAHNELARRSSTLKIISEVMVLNNGWKPDWKDKTQKKWYIALDRVTGKPYSYGRNEICHLPDVYAMKNGTVAQRLLKELPEDLIRVLT